MNAMILAAGRGTRLGEPGLARPKILFDVGGEPLLARHLRALEHQGVRRVVINAHHLAEHIEAFVSAYEGPLELVCVVEERLLGTAGGVRNALRHLRPGPFIVIYGDTLIHDAVSDAVATHRSSGAVATLVVHAASAAEGKGVVEVDDDWRVTGFVEKPEGVGHGDVWINSGVYVLEEDFVTALASGVELDFGNDVLPQAVARGEAIFAHPFATAVVDIGTPDGLELARAHAATDGDGRPESGK